LSASGGSGLRLDEGTDEAERLRAESDAERGGLEPRRQIGHLSGDHELPVRLGHGDGLAGGDADAQLEGGAVLSLEGGIQEPHAFLHGDSGSNGPLGVVLVHVGDTEDRHDGIPRVLLDHASEGTHLLGHLCEVCGQKRANLFGVVPHGELGRTGEIGEEHGDELAFFGGAHRITRPPPRRDSSGPPASVRVAFTSGRWASRPLGAMGA